MPMRTSVPKYKVKKLKLSQILHVFFFLLMTFEIRMNLVLTDKTDEGFFAELVLLHDLKSFLSFHCIL